MRYWRYFCFILFLCSALLPGGCARGVAEFQLYVQAFNSQYAQGDAILDSVARAERILMQRRLKRLPFNTPFNPDDAAYYVDGVDPPLTGQIRGALKSLKSYNDALGALANGEAAAALSSRIGTLATNVAGTLAAAQVGGLASIPGAEQMSSELSRGLNLAAPFINEVVIFASREAFRHQLIAAYPAMRKVLLTLRDGTPVLSYVMERSRAQRTVETPSQLSEGEQSAFEKDRAQLAGWVLLLDKTLVAMDAAVVAAMSDVGAADLASLSEASIELRVLAEKVKSLRSK